MSLGKGTHETQHPLCLIVATQNAGKIRELGELLANLRVELRAAAGMPAVEETGSTFTENAALKARAAAAHFGLWALADDSGLEVDALDGEPGVRSARYGTPDVTTDAGRNALLLERLRGVPAARRTARFRAAIALAAPDGRLWVREGACEGRIAHAPRGERGFGYDPVFYLPERGLTMAELSPDEKNAISHRARAMHRIREVIRGLVG